MKQDHELDRPDRRDDIKNFVLTPDQIDNLADEAKQAEYRRAYQQQLDQRTCPGCGDD